MGIVIDIIIVVISLAAILIGVLRSVSRGLFVTLMHIAGVSLAVVLSGVATALVIPPVNSALASLIANSHTALANFLPGNASARELLMQLPGALLTPFVFVVFFFVLKIIFDIVIFFTTKGEKGKLIKFSGQKAVAGVLGLILAVGCLWIFLMPLTGTVRTSGQVVSWVAANKNSISGLSTGIPSSMEWGLDFVSTMGDSKLVKLYDGVLGSGKVFDNMCSVDVKGKRMSLPAEVESVLKLANTVMTVVPNSGTENGNKQTTAADVSSALRDIAEQLDDAQITSSIAVDEIDNAVAVWKEGGEYLGVKMITGNSRTDEL
ncbi:MAG: hypothetical protein J6112_09775, partial [Clostridia bacterium]|nr:hypothetical protein [Clostridia bacterium]